MSKLRIGINLLRNNRRALLSFIIEKMGFLLNDKLYLKLLFRIRMGYRLNLDNPKTFSEKIQWLKIYDRQPRYTTLVDKYLVKDIVADIIGKEHIIPTIGVWDNPESIEWDKLPKQFVLKTTHGGGNSGVVICKDKNLIDRQHVIDKLNKSLKQDIYKTFREWPYKNVPRKILAEKFMVEENCLYTTKDLEDYKFFCFNGVPKIMFVASDRANKVCFDYYDMHLRHLNLKQGGDNYKGEVKLPQHFEEMKAIEAKISKNIPHVRTDFYEINNKVYFGELTFFDSSGFARFEPEEWDEKLGELIDLDSI